MLDELLLVIKTESGLIKMQIIAPASTGLTYCSQHKPHPFTYPSSIFPTSHSPLPTKRPEPDLQVGTLPFCLSSSLPLHPVSTAVGPPKIN